MERFLNIGVIQMPVSTDTAENLRYIEERVTQMMSGFRRPELIVGVECISCATPQTIPGSLTTYFGEIAKKHSIYFIPGTIYEKSDNLPEGKFYNTAPVFNPKGELIAAYRKMAPWWPLEEEIVPGRQYVVFDIPEKQTKVGVQICYDLNFPEISRNETLMGAEVLIKLTLDPQELYQLNRPIHFARALENQAFLVSTNGVGFRHGSHLYGHSMVIDPQGQLLWEAAQTEAVATITLDLDLVKRCREYGTQFIEHYLQHVRSLQLPEPFAGRESEAPLFQSLRKMPDTTAEYAGVMQELGLTQISRQADIASQDEEIKENLEKFLETKINNKKEF